MAKEKKIPTKDTIKRMTVKSMKELGVYKPQYSRVIDIYVDVVHQFLILNKEFEEDGYTYSTITAAGGEKKSAIVATLEVLRKDILAYSDRLCLNPKSIENITINKQEKSVLASVLSGLDE